MPVFAIFPDEKFRRRLCSTLCFKLQLCCQGQEFLAFFRHIVVYCALQDVSHLAFQRAVVPDGPYFQGLNQIVIQLSHVNCCHSI